jgi:hypothetical protein
MTNVSEPLLTVRGESPQPESPRPEGDTTVTTETASGWEINFEIFKINESQTVTTVETTNNDQEDEGYVTECDDNGDCVCVEE